MEYLKEPGQQVLDSDTEAWADKTFLALNFHLEESISWLQLVGETVECTMHLKNIILHVGLGKHQ